MTFKMYSRECRLRVVADHETQRRKRHRHHIDLAQLFHVETGLVTSRHSSTGRR
jgi:hypothetical protein